MSLELRVAGGERKALCHFEEGASPLRGDRTEFVQRVRARRNRLDLHTAEYSRPRHRCIQRRKVPHAGFAAVQDDIFTSYSFGTRVVLFAD